MDTNCDKDMSLINNNNRPNNDAKTKKHFTDWLLTKLTEVLSIAWGRPC